MITAKVDIDAVLKRVRNMVSQANNLGGVFDKILGPAGDSNQFSIRGGVAAAFYSKGGSINSPWAPLNADYFKKKQKLYPGTTTLIASGALFQSLNGSNFYTVDIRTNRSMTYGTIVPYAGYHQSDAPRKRLPRRPFFGPTPDQVARWKVLLAAAIKGAK